MLIDFESVICSDLATSRESFSTSSWNTAHVTDWHPVLLVQEGLKRSTDAVLTTSILEREKNPDIKYKLFLV